MAFLLTLLGTDTDYTPQSSKEFDKAESLSYVSSLVPFTSASDPDDVFQYRNDKVAVVKGPATYGQDVGDRIARGVYLILEAVSRGEKQISVIAHSRGAVQAILVSHEVQRIKELLVNPKGFHEKISNSQCQYTKLAMEGVHKQRLTNLNWINIINSIQDVTISMVNIDPVPGGYETISDWSGITWYDERFYQVPEIVAVYEQFIYENELSACFRPVMPQPESKDTHFRIHTIPGNHGTGSGNLLAQNRKPIPDQYNSLTTEHVQELIIVRLLDFLNVNGVETTKKQEEDPFDSLTVRLFQSNTELNRDVLTSIYLELFEKIQANREKYRYFNKTNYDYLSQDQGYFADFRFAISQRDRYVLYKKPSSATYACDFLQVLIPPVSTVQFVNHEHARIYINHYLGLEANIPLSEMVNGVTNRLLSLADNEASTAMYDSVSSVDSFRSSSSYDVVSPVTGTQNLSRALESEQTANCILEAVGNLIKEVTQGYLQNKFTQDEQQAIYNSVRRIFIKFNAKSQSSPWTGKVFSKLKEALDSTLTLKQKKLEEQYLNITNKLAGESSALTLLGDNLNSMGVLVEGYTTTESSSDDKKAQLIAWFNEVHLALANFLADSPQVKEISDFLKSEKIIGLSNQLKDISLNIYSQVSLLIDAAVNEIINYQPNNLFKELIVTYHELYKFKNSLYKFQQLDETFQYEECGLKLEEYKARLIYVAAKYILENEIPIGEVEQFFGEDRNSQTLYHEIAGLAFGMGVTNPSTVQLRAEKDQQQQDLADMTFEKEEQKRLVADITAQKEEQERELIDTLAQREVQARLLAEMTAQSEQQARQLAEVTAQSEQQARQLAEVSAIKEQQEARVANLTNHIENLDAEIARLEVEKQNVTQENGVLQDQLAQASKEKSATVTEYNATERNIEQIINTKLIPLTQEYLTHLAHEIKKSVDTELDTSDHSNLINNVNEIKAWPSDQASQLLKDKFNEVSRLYQILESDSKPSHRVKQFHQHLTTVDTAVSVHRDPAWRRYALMAFSILATGVIPGLGLLAYAAFSGKTPRFFQSNGRNFLQDTFTAMQNSGVLLVK